MIQTSPFDVAVLLSTIYLKTAWADPFDKDDNLVEYFTDEDGKRTKCEFMSEQGIGTVYSGSCFKAIRKQMNEEFDMFLVLPNKGTDLWEVMGCKDVYVLISSPFPPNSRDCYVIARVPKFDVSAYNNLDDMMKSLGITDVFDYKAADFSPFIKGRQFYISEADQAARVKIDEEGFEGAAWTRMDMTWGCADPYAGMEMEVVKFYLDRPFAFFVVKRGIPVFAGTVTQPIETDKEYIGGKEIDVEAILKELKKARKGFDSFLSLSSSMDDDKEDEEP